MYTKFKDFLKQFENLIYDESIAILKCELFEPLYV